MSATLTVLGSSGSYPGPGRACSSYLVTVEGYRLLLDCGNGALTNLPCDPADLDAVLLSHLHPDHCADVYGLHIALRHGPSAPARVDVHAPAGAGERLGGLLDAEGREGFLEHLRFHEAAAGQRLALGPLSVTLFPAAHPLETLASRLELHGRPLLSYTGDSGPCEALVACGEGTGLLVGDATWPESARPVPADLHCTGGDLGRIAARAGARRLLVTHVQPAYDPAEVAADAAAAYDGQILVAHDRMEIAL